MSVVPLEDVKEHLQITTSDNDAELLLFIEAAESSVAQHIGPLVPTTVTSRVPATGWVLLLPHRNILSVATIDGAPLAGGDYLSPSGEVYLDRQPAGRRGFVTATYSVGFDPLPADIQLAIMEMIRHLWSTQRGNATSGGARADLLGVTGEPTTAAGMASYSMPHRVKELLGPYMSQSSVA